jgi:ABC-2 type transport system ATP-binding protein
MITVENVTKRYGDTTAVRDVTFRCLPGTVTGFLGPNGAGKSTTLRIVCGLTRATSGATSVLGTDYRRLPSPGRRVGVLLDASAQHAGRTGREVLGLAARVLDVPAGRVPALLAAVGLDEAAARRRVGRYSLGMRQRLGLALALLGDPSVLILDEPANGLDPEGIHGMRLLLRAFADRGGTVLLSSHLLREVEAVADHVVVIAAGRVVADGHPAQLLGRSGAVVRAADPRRLREVLGSRDLAVRVQADGALLVDAAPEVVGRAAADHSVALHELRPGGGDLEDLYLALTQHAPAPVVEVAS